MKKEYENPMMEIIITNVCVITSSGDNMDNWEVWPMSNEG